VGGVVLAVLVGGVTFVGVANRERVANYFEAREKVAETPVAQGEVDPGIARRLEDLEVAWIEAHLFKYGKTELGELSARSSALAHELEAAGRQRTWSMVNLARIRGDFAVARRLVGVMSSDLEDPYALAILDLAESPSSPPWSLILERLRKASTGERGSSRLVLHISMRLWPPER
jgi:hypothetical protein